MARTAEAAADGKGMGFVGADNCPPLRFRVGVCGAKWQVSGGTADSTDWDAGSGQGSSPCGGRGKSPRRPSGQAFTSRFALVQDDKRGQT